MLVGSLILTASKTINRAQQVGKTNIRFYISSTAAEPLRTKRMALDLVV
jgi:hypothetical protein